MADVSTLDSRPSTSLAPHWAVDDDVTDRTPASFNPASSAASSLNLLDQRAHRAESSLLSFFRPDLTRSAVCLHRWLPASSPAQLSSPVVTGPARDHRHVTHPAISLSLSSSIDARRRSVLAPASLHACTMHRTYSMRQSRAPTASQLENPPPPPSTTKTGRLFGRNNFGERSCSCTHSVPGDD